MNARAIRAARTHLFHWCAFFFSDFSLLVIGSELLVSWWKAEKERQGLRDKAEG